MDASRRDSLRLLAGGSAGLGLVSAGWAAAEPPPQTRRIRLPRFPGDVACASPMWIASELLRAEGSDWRYLNELKRELKSWPCPGSRASGDEMMIQRGTPISGASTQ